MAVIFHLDLDSFFVSAERLRNPALRGRVIAIGGDGPRGVIASASYEARKFGVRSAMPTAMAKRACPQLLLVRGDYEYYSKLSREVFSIVARFAPVHEQTGIDEGYLDMTGTAGLFGPPLEAAAKLRQAVREATGLTISIGIASNRRVAKIATDTCKPDGIREVLPGTEREFLAPLSVGVIPGVGKVTEKWLHERAIFRISDLQRRSRDSLVSELGSMGEFLHDASQGRGSVAFHEESKTRSTSRERTFSRDVAERARIGKYLWEMCEEIGAQLRKDGDFARVTKLKLRYPPFETVVRSRTLEWPTQSDRELFEAVENLFDRSWDGRPLRLVGAGFALGNAGERQLGLFEQHRLVDEERQQALDRLKDEVRRRFGDQALQTGKGLADS